MIAVPSLDLFAAAQVNTEGGAKEGRFDIVGYNRVAAKDHLHIVTTNQFGDVAARAGVDDGWTQHKEDFAVARARLFHLAGDFVDCQYLDLFGGDVALHEGEGFSFARALERLHANTIMADDDQLTHLHFVHGLAIRTTSGGVDDDGNIHFYAFDSDPLPAQAHLCWQIGRGVELCGKHAVLLHGHCLRVLAMKQYCSKLLQFGDDEI